MAAGQWFFRYRNAMFPLTFIAIPLLLRPRVMWGHPILDHALVVSGVVITLLGEAVRLLTIGFEYVERGGKNKQVWASRLVRGGMYSHTRNPMYLGNLLIALGMCMASGAPMAYLIILPLFVFVYQAIVCAEEAFLLETFGSDYAQYCATVPRVLPTVRGLRRSFVGITYDWRRAVRKDLSTIAGILIGLILFPVWRTYFLEGFEAAKAKTPTALGLVLTVLVLYGLLHHVKKHTRLLYLPPTP